MKKFVLLVISAFLVIVAVSGLLLNKTQAEPVGVCPPLVPEYTVHLPDSERCDSFYKCDYSGPVFFTCPAGLYFNPELEVCDWPQNVDCRTP
ncbi:chitin binding domain-containing protein [Nostoc sp. FACHB-973]|nr:chitin binding domain-containing protein [Nostoc sp. FACHB-973]